MRFVGESPGSGGLSTRRVFWCLLGGDFLNGHKLGVGLDRTYGSLLAPEDIFPGAVNAITQEAGGGVGVRSIRLQVTGHGYCGASFLVEWRHTGY